jgi:hypothetical protein
MKRFLISLCRLIILSPCGQSLTAAPVPYAGKVDINGLNFQGDVQFTFALRDANGTVHWRNGVDEAVQDAQEKEVQTEASPESNQSSVVIPPAKTTEVGKIDLDDPATLDKVIAEAIDKEELQKRGKGSDVIIYAPNQQTPYTGWVKEMRDNGQIKALAQLKDGKLNGLWTSWYDDGQKSSEYTSKDGKMVFD